MTQGEIGIEVLRKCAAQLSRQYATDIFQMPLDEAGDAQRRLLATKDRVLRELLVQCELMIRKGDL